jgi:hypothetical protein
MGLKIELSAEEDRVLVAEATPAKGSCRLQRGTMRWDSLPAKMGASQRLFGWRWYNEHRKGVRIG